MLEYDDIVRRITSDMDKDAKIIAGMYFDSSMEDRIRVTLIAAGFNEKNELPKLEVVKPASRGEIMPDSEFSRIAGSGDFLSSREKRDSYSRYNDDDLDVPTVIRDRRFINFPNDTTPKKAR